MNTLFLSLGSNRGDRLSNLRKAVGLVGIRVGPVTRFSPVFETPPWGFADPTPFYNCAVEVLSELSPSAVMHELLRIENELGRKRGVAGDAGGPSRRYLPRTIDIDILFYDDLILNTDDLIIPHPGIANRRFVLEPLNQLCPEFVHPVLKKTIRELLALCQDTSEVSVIPFDL